VADFPLQAFVRQRQQNIRRLPTYVPFRYASNQRISMLVVTRKKDEKLIIGNEIEIQVLRIGRDNVRLGIKAPAHISIYRYEIYEAIKSENVNAVTSQIPDKETLDKISKSMKVE
jgi:carbon storage regulator